jgi:hypothetical protein
MPSLSARRAEFTALQSVILRCPRTARASKDTGRGARAVALRGSLRSHLRVTEKRCHFPRDALLTHVPIPVTLASGSYPAVDGKPERLLSDAIAAGNRMVEEWRNMPPLSKKTVQAVTAAYDRMMEKFGGSSTGPYLASQSPCKAPHKKKGQKARSSRRRSPIQP